MFDGRVFPRNELGQFGENMRRYLPGEIPFPDDMAVIVIVSSDKESRTMWLAPEQPWVEADCLNFRFLARGIMFRVMMGYRMFPMFREMSCTSPRKCLLYGDAGHRTKPIAERFAEQLKAMRQ